MALHVVAMARTKNTARSNPFELPRATVTDHILGYNYYNR